MPTILVTGFEPFGGEAVNASWEAARRLDGWREAVAYQRERIDRLAQEVKNVAAELFGAGSVFATKKEAFLHAYRQHPDYGDRGVAAKVAAELAPTARLQPGSARSYVYEELGRANGDSK